MKTITRGLIGAAAAMMLVLLAAGLWFFDIQEEHLHDKVEAELQSIAQLKVNQVVQWRKALLAQAQVISESPFVAAHLTQWLAAPSPAATDQILAWFRSLEKNSQYSDILLVDPQGQTRLSLSGQSHTIAKEALQTLDAKVRDGIVAFSPLHKLNETDATAHWDVIVPLFSYAGERKKALGGLVMRIDASRTFHPMVQNWPGLSQSAETLLVAQDGDHVLFLNELRHQENTALRLRIPLTEKNMMAVMAVDGERGFVEGRDYRGVEVLSVLSEIPDTPWLMVTKIDKAEALAEWRIRSLLIMGLMLGIAAAFMTALGMAWQGYAKKQYQAAFLAEVKQRQAETTLRQTHQLLERAEEIANIGWLEFDLKSRAVWASASARRIYGLAEDDWTIEAVQTIPLPEYRSDLDRALNGLVESNEPYDIEFRILRPTDGAVLDIRAQAEYKSKEEKIFWVIRDITERKQTEAQQEQLRTQLLQSQKLESVGRLAGGVAHDLNNLLSPILGYGDMLLVELPAQDARRQYAQYIIQAGIRARDLIRQLLAFGRKQTLVLEIMDLNEVVGGFAKLLHRAVREDIAIEIVPASNLPSVRGDVGQIEQVIMNLVVNAQDAMPDGGTVIIETAVVELDETYTQAHFSAIPGRYVVLTITDTGFGMDAEVCAQIFTPFFTTKEQGKGTGLGLATTYGIVKQHGGNIWVYSEPGQGTTFKVYLPAVDSAPDLKVLEPVAVQAVASGNETVMVVEDDEMVRKMTVDMLNRWGYRVLEASGGADCLEKLSNHSGAAIDLLITDVVMPDMNGKKLYEQVASGLPGLKVLYMSGYTENVIASRGVLDQGVNFIQKPFDPNRLAAKIRVVLES